MSGRCYRDESGGRSSGQIRGAAGRHRLRGLGGEMLRTVDIDDPISTMLTCYRAATSSSGNHGTGSNIVYYVVITDDPYFSWRSPILAV